MASVVDCGYKRFVGLLQIVMVMLIPANIQRTLDLCLQMSFIDYVSFHYNKTILCVLIISKWSGIILYSKFHLNSIINYW